MTKAELKQISHAFKKMIEAIPKTRVGEHMFAIMQIKALLEKLQREAEGAGS